MALEIFALLDAEGDQAEADHIFTGNKADLEFIAVALDAAFAKNRRLRSITGLAERFHTAASQPLPALRLNKADCIRLVEVISGYAVYFPKKSKTRKLANQLEKVLFVF